MPRYPSSKVSPSKFTTEKRYCSGCTHHLSYHQLITRDKWDMLYEQNPLTTHRIPWFCEFTVQNPVTNEEHICGCNNLKPTTQEEIRLR